MLIFVGCNKNNSSYTTLNEKNWDTFNKTQIEKLINTYGNASKDYNASKPPYVVFDWDNTSIFLDIEEATLKYQLENLIFGCNPDQLDTAIHIGIKDTVLKNSVTTFNDVAADIKNSYIWLYQNYKSFNRGGKLNLEEIRKYSDYKNFISKLRYLYEAVNETYSPEVAYPWVTYLFSGLDSTQVRKMTAETIRSQKKDSIGKITWESPETKDFSRQLSGKISVTFKNGLRLIPEMQELYDKFRNAGFDVWICSASFVDVVKEISSNPEFGYKNNDNHVLAMELERNEKGKIEPKFRKGYFQTQGKGKYLTIKKFLAGSTGKYGYSPVFIAGDSEGDQNMLCDFPIQLGLIINRQKGKGKLLGALSRSAVMDSARFLLQGRDEKKGTFTPNQGPVKFCEQN
jgi:phosphoserine phosphatase